MIKSRFKLATWALLLTTIVFACSKSPEPAGEDTTPTNSSNANRKALLENVADNIVLPAYASFKVKFDLMVAKSDAFSASPDATTLNEFREAWSAAYIEWQKVELFDFGPGQVYAIRSYFNIYPANVAGIEAGIASGAANLEVPASFSQQGFPALDYLLNGLAATDQTTLTFYTSAPDAAKRIAYLKKVTGHMNSVFSKSYGEWNTTFASTFKSKTSIDAGSSTSTMVNSFVLNYERFIRSGKIGIPSGALSGGVIGPEKVEAYYKKDLSLILAKTANQASIDFLNGKSVKTGMEGYSIKTYLNSLDAKDSKTGLSLSDNINQQLNTINQKLNNLPANLHNEIKTNNQTIVDVYNQMQSLIRLLKVDMTSAMSITITYTDNDGD